MPCYVDAARWPLSRMLMCHLIADTLDELHSMAEQVGCQRAWFQGEASTPHYDLSKERRTRAIKAGAIVLGRRELVQKIRAIRAQSSTLERLARTSSSR